MGDMQYDYLFKVFIIGDSGTGKSCIMQRFAENKYTGEFVSTIGVDFKIQTIETNDGKTCKLQIWDTAGQERFKTITSIYYRGAHGILVTFDITNEESFLNVPKWMHEVSRFANQDPCMILIGAKADLEDQRAVSKERAEAFAKERGMSYIETSSKENINIQKSFFDMADQMVESQNGGAFKP